MRACVQRVTRAAVTVDDEVIGSIELGLVVLLGVAAEDNEGDARQMANKIVQLRIFADDQGHMNRSLLEVRGSMLVVSQFTLLGDCRKGRRPGFTAAADPAQAEALYKVFVAEVAGQGIRVATGKFRAMMQVDLVNDGPVTLLLDSTRLF